MPENKILIVDLSGNEGGDRVVELSPEVVSSTNGDLVAYRFNSTLGTYEVGNSANDEGTDFVWEAIIEGQPAPTG